MNTSPTAPRAALAARARKHFAAIAASSVLLTGGLAAVTAAQTVSAEPSTTVPDGSGTSGTTGSNGPTSDTSGSTGLTSPQPGSAPDAGSNAS
ncbi:hypothetical protein [Aeromicrobium sp. Sec7.5]|uniref:hypothetical protein n=1 Tax=Aeromicrobium sp. Sec7.5 TaxID=3121276 RepID=UPI002FE4E3D2